jgi:hypothetical protein
MISRAGLKPARFFLHCPAGTTINLVPVVYTPYLFAGYSGLGAEVWYVGDLHGIITIPAIFKPVRPH